MLHPHHGGTDGGAAGENRSQQASDRRTASVSSEETHVDNISFISHMSSLGRGVGGGANLASIEAAADSIIHPHSGREPHREGRGAHSTAGDAIDEEDASTTSIAKQFFITGLPLTASALAQFSLNMVIVSVIGRCLGVAELGGASLALGIVNATGFAFGAGLCGALETVLSHTYGAFEQRVAAAEAAQLVARESGSGEIPPDPPRTLYMYGIYAQRMAVILFVIAFPLGVVLCFIDGLLELLGESSAVIFFTGVWCRYALFGIPAALAYQLVQRYYSCQHITKPLSVALIAAALANPVLQIVFVKLFGFRGSPIAWILLMVSIVGGLVGYMAYTGLYKRTWGGLSKEGLQNIGDLTKVAIPSMGVMLSEWSRHDRVPRCVVPEIRTQPGVFVL